MQKYLMVLIFALAVTGCKVAVPAPEKFESEQGDVSTAADLQIGADAMDSAPDTPSAVDGATESDSADAATTADVQTSVDAADSAVDAVDSADAGAQPEVESDTADSPDIADTTTGPETADMYEIADDSVDASEVGSDVDVALPDACTPGGCDDADPCTDDACDKLKGCGHVANALPCGDGDACTVGDVCKDSACSPGALAVCDDGKVCTDDSCDKSKGCVNAANAATCTDGDACTLGDACKNAACLSGAVTACDDGNLCTDDGCDKAKGCGNVANSAACVDGDACTAGDKCADGQCAGIAVDVSKTCDDNDDCTAETCDSKTGCVHSKQTGTTCNDGNFCTKDDVCVKGNCAGQAIVCSDDKVCTDDSCAPLKGCVYAANFLACDDANACTSGDACAGGACTGKVVDCDDKNGCTDDSCDKAKGCVNLANTSTCSDGDACTGGDVCALGKCGGVVVKCDDGNGCTDDSCDKLKGCVKAANAMACDDLTACTSGDVCSAGKCAGKVVDCDDKNVCTDDSCDKAKGCVNAANAVVCSDGDACTVGDTCAAAKCAPGAAVKCDDANVCTDDSCDKLKGCVNAPNSLACDDGAACTTGDVCVEGKCAVGNAQFFNVTYGGPQDDHANALIALADGGLLLGGTTNSNAKTDYDFWLVRTDVFGKLLWSKSYGGSQTDLAYGVALLADGGFALVGSSASVDLPIGQKSKGGMDFWLVRTDGDGKLLWNVTHGGSNQEVGHAVTALVGGGLALAGSSNSDDLPGGLKTAGSDDFWLVRTDVNGKMLWSQTYGGSGSDMAYAVTALADGGLALAGITQSSDLPGGQKATGQSDFWLVRVDVTGKLLWNQTYGGSGLDQLRALTVTADGGFAMAGATKSIDLPGGQKTAGQNDFWLVRTDASGKLLWNQTYGGSGIEEAFALNARPGGLVMAGRTDSADLPGGMKSNGNSTDFWVVCTDSSGNLLWNRTYGGTSGDQVYAMATLADGGLGLAGEAQSIDLPGGQKSAGGEDLWLVRTDAWGHASCADAGGCFGKKVEDCDDKNPCTADICDGKSGCLHGNLADGSTCDDGDACTIGDVCAMGKCVTGKDKFFSTTYAGIKSQLANAVTVLPDGYAFAGYKISKDVGGEDFWLVRTDPAGKLVWENVYGGFAEDAATALAAVTDGFALAGVTESKGAGTGDFWLVRTDSSGKVIWDNTYGGAGFDQANSLAALSDGFALAGSTNSKGSGQNDFWLVRTDAAGKAMWDKTYGGAGNDVASALAAVTGGFALVGSTDTGAGGVGFSAWLVRTDAAGNKIWSKTYGDNTKGDWANAVAPLIDGFAILGVSQSKGAGLTDFWLIRTDAVGNLLWDKTYGGKDSDQAFGLAVVSDGFALAGYSKPIGKPVAAWLVHTDSIGNATWSQTYGGLNFDVFRAIAANLDGFTLAGESDSKNYAQASLFRTDPWGHASCADAGGCFGKKVDDCDDKNPCTFDNCNAAKGCINTPMPQFAICGTGGLSCGATGKCDFVQGMVLIPGGEFWMGCNEAVESQLCTQDGQPDDKPEHKVKLDSFFMDKYEVTVAQYTACTDAKVCSEPGTGLEATWNQCCGGKAQHPVNFVNWDQAVAYCKFVGRRLPTEAEWEMAARGSCDKYPNQDCKTAMPIFPWGNSPSTWGGQQSCAYVQLGLGICGNGTAPVGSAPAGLSQFGIYDMAGNVGEWVADFYAPNYYAISPAFAPSGPIAGAERVIRGSGFFNQYPKFIGDYYYRTGFRGHAPPATTDGPIGFRCVKSLP